MFVTPLDFIDLPYNFPKMNDADTQSVMQKFITRNEAIELREVFGSDFYEAFITAMNALPAAWLPGPASYNTNSQVLYGYDVYKALQDGLVNVKPDSDNTKWELQDRSRWQKLWAGESYKDINGATENWVGMKELVKPLIYALWLDKEITTSVQGSGVIQQTSENAVNVTSNIRYSDALMDYSLKVGKLDRHEKDTLYNYLYTNATVFNDIASTAQLVNGDFINYLTYYFKNPGFVNDFNF